MKRKISLRAGKRFDLDLRTVRRRLQISQRLKVRNPPQMVNIRARKQHYRVLLTVFARYRRRLCRHVVDVILVLVRSRFLVLAEV